jgi:hypothetical protein
VAERHKLIYDIAVKTFQSDRLSAFEVRLIASYVLLMQLANDDTLLAWKANSDD